MRALAAASCFIALCGCDPSATSQAIAPSGADVLKSRTALDFGAVTKRTHLLDSADVNGDGFAAGARIDAPDVSSFLRSRKPPSFVVPARPDGRMQPYSLGAGGTTHRAFSGVYFKTADGGPMAFALARNGEIGLPGDNRGAPSGLFRLCAAGDGLAIRQIFEDPANGASGGIAACDIG